VADVDLKDRLVLVAGGTGGLGRAVSLAFLAAGARVAATYRRQAELDEVAGAAGADRARLEGHAVDATDEAGVSRLLDDLVARHGGLDAMVNTVGGWAGGAKAWEAGGDELDRMLSVNLRSGWVLARAAARVMVPRGRGSIVNVASKAGDELDRMLSVNLRSGWVLARAAARVMVPRGRGSIVNVASKAGIEPTPGAAAYAASKAAAIALIESLAADLKGTGVRANSVLPSVIDTEANRKAMPRADFAKWPKPEEIARVILFLCSDAAALVHGAAIPVYGGR